MIVPVFLQYFKYGKNLKLETLEVKTGYISYSL